MLKTMTALSIHLLGPFQIAAAEYPLTALPSTRLQPLLAILLLTPKQTLSRSHVAATIWPDLSESLAKSRLRRLLYDIRQSLPELEAYLVITSGTIGWRFDAPYKADVQRFEQAIEQAQKPSYAGAQALDALKTAAATYHGEFLQGYNSDWVEPHRQRYAQQYTQVLEDLTGLLIQQNQLTAALPYAQERVWLNPLQETGYFTLMQLHLRLGQREQALQVYEQCAEQLVESLGIDPSGALQTLRQSAIAPNPPPSILTTLPVVSSQPSTAPTVDWGAAPDVSSFQGRQSELEQLQSWIIPFQCRLVAILGVGGMGKTALSVKLSQQLLEAAGQSCRDYSPTEPSQSSAQFPGFTHIIWRSLRTPLPFKTLLSDWISILSNGQDTDASPRRLLHYLRQTCCLLVLDNVESILQEGSHAGYCQSEYAEYGEFFRLIGEASHKSCLVLTSREKPSDIAILEGCDSVVRSMTIGGVPEAAAMLMDTKQLLGSSAEKQALGDRYSWNPLALKIVTTSIQENFEGCIADFLQEDCSLVNGLRRVLAQQFKRLSDIEQTLMFWIAINRDWTTIHELLQDIKTPISKTQLLEGLESLRWRSLLEKRTQPVINPASKQSLRSSAYTQQPVILEYVTIQLVERLCQELTDFHHVGKPLNDLYRFALLKTTVTEDVRVNQTQILLQPIWHHVCHLGETEAGRRQLLSRLLQSLQSDPRLLNSYAAGNLLNLGCQAQYDWDGADFSGLTLHHAHLQDAKIQRVNFSNARFTNATFTQTFASVLAVAYSPDNQYLATGDSNTELQLWSTKDSQLLLTLQGHQDWIRTVSFSPNSQILVSACDAGEILCWDVKTGDLLNRLQGHSGRVSSLKFSPDGTHLISAGEDGIIRLWNIKTGVLTQTFTGHQQAIWSVVVHPQGQQLASSSDDQTIRIWDLETGECLAALEGHQNSIWSLSYSPDGNYLASGSYDGVLKIWKLKTYICQQSLTGHHDWICSVIFHPYQPLIATGGNDETIRIWHAETGQCLKVLQGHHHRIWSLAFSPDGKQLASAGDDQTLRLWDVEHWLPIKTLQGNTHQVIAIACSPDNQTIASGGDEQHIRLWNRETGECQRLLKGHRHRVMALIFTPGQNLLISGGEDTTVRVWNPNQGKLLQTLQGHQKQVWSVAISPDERWIASGSEDQTIRLWNIETGDCCHILEGHQNWVWKVAFSPCGRWLASASYDKTIRLWDVETGQCSKILKGHEGAVMAIAFTPDASFLASASVYDKTIRIWHVATGECSQQIEEQDTLSLAFSPHTNSNNTYTLASASMSNQSIQLWKNINFSATHSYSKLSHVDALQKAEILFLEGHNRWCFDLEFSSDGKSLVSGSADESIKLWDVKNGSCMRSLRPARPYESVDISGVTGLSIAQRKILCSLGAMSAPDSLEEITRSD